VFGGGAVTCRSHRFERSLGKGGFSVRCRSDPYERVGLVDESSEAGAAGCDGDELLAVARVRHGAP
jgi:hypothetical protein